MRMPEGRKEELLCDVMYAWGCMDAAVGYIGYDYLFYIFIT